MNFQGKPKKILITSLKVVGWTVVSIVGILILIALSIQIPFVQNKIVQEAVGFLKGKIGTEVRLDHISLSIPKKIVLTGLYLEDQRKDTLLYAGELAVNTDLFALTKHTIQLNDVDLTDFTGNIVRTKKDSAFNFDYIIKAFVSEEPTPVPKDTTQKPWRFSIGDIALERIRLTYNDDLQGNDIALNLEKLDVGVEEFDLEQPLIKIGDISIENLVANVEQNQLAADTVATAPESQDPSSPFNISAEQIDLKNIKANYAHHGTGQIIKLALGELSLDAKEINLADHEILLDELELENTFISIQQLAGYSQMLEKKSDADSVGTKQDNWHITVNDLTLSNNAFQYYNFEEQAKQNAFDPNRIWITALSTEAENLEWQGNNARGTITAFSFADRSGFSVKTFKSEVALTNKSLTVEDLVFDSPHSHIALDAKANFSSLETLSKDYPQAKLQLNINESTIAWKDIAYFASDLTDSVPVSLNDRIFVKIDTEIAGALRDLTLDHLTIQTLEQTKVNASGKIRILEKDIFMDVQLEKFYTTKKDLLSIVADTLIPASIALPQWINLAGHFKGTTASPDLKSILTSDLGAIELNAVLKKDNSSQLQHYRADIKVKEFHLGKLLKQEQQMGQLTMSAALNGSGTTLEELNTQLDLKVQHFLYQNYLYKNFTLNGRVKKFYFDGTAKLEDKNLNMRLDGELDYNAEIPKYHFDFELKNADFKALHLTERPLRARGTLNIDLATSDFKVINGKLDIRKFAVYNGEAMYAVDSLLFASIDQQGQSEISIRSDIIEGNFAGTINLYSLPEVLRRHFNNYFSLHEAVYKKPAQPQNFKFDLKIKNTDLITEVLVPELDPFVPGRIAGEFDSNEDRLDLGISLAKINYSGIGADSITFDATSNKDELTYALALRKIKMDTMQMEALRLSGNVGHDSIRTKLTILDSLQKEKYVLGGVFHSLEKVFQFKFFENEIIMNYAPWIAPPDNALQFTSRGIRAHNFSITNINEKIALETSDRDSVVAIVFKDLNLQNITKLVEGTTPIDGLANGDFKMMTSQKGAFNSKLKIDGLEVFKQQWGNLSLVLDQKVAAPLNIDLNVSGDKTDIRARGYFESDPAAPEINFTTTISKLNLAAIEPLTMGQLKNTKGQITGEVKIVGDPSKPDIDGALNFEGAAFTPSKINSEFLLEDETISVTNGDIVFDNFEIRDSKNNIAKLDGTIKTAMFSTFDMNLNLSANDFQILNSTDKDNELFYGKVRITTKAKITGTLNQPVINMNINLGDDSDFTYVVPQSEKGVLEQKGIVEWVDRDAKKDPFLASINPKDTIKSTFTGIDLSANIELNDKEVFNIIIDPLTGDKLSVKGNSTLTLDMDPTGDMVLSGRYEITEGSYDLSFYRIVKRKFLIEKGSTIIWAGAPTDATLNIRAIYEVETSPMELVVPEGVEDPKYKQRLPFQVYLQIKGEMLTPEISFLLDMPEEKRNVFGGTVYAKIRDINTRESELNKQVFALLVLKRFISENPLDNRAGSDVASTARRSVSKLLSEQLNRLSENIKGVELTFDVKSSEDYSSGSAEGQTQVQLGLQKTLLDDRLVVKVSGNVEVEGETSNQSSASDYIGDLALEYKLTEDGRFRITGFRNSNYDMINGELIETGVGLIYIKDYNSLRELFKPNAEEK